MDTKESMDHEVAALLEEMLRTNDLTTEEVISAIFTVTPDLVSEFPAASARRAGWSGVPMLGAVEIAVPGALARTLRVMIHVETVREKREITHVYRGEARVLRPDLTS
jgi:chorismate mutase